MGGIVKVTDLVGEIAAASNEQAQGVSQINQGLGQIDQVTQQNTANAEETASAAEELAGQASQMQEMIQRFKLSSMVVGSATSHYQTAAAHPKALANVGEGKGATWGQSKTLGAPKTASAPVGGKGEPKEIIALDDKEFGKY